MALIDTGAHRSLISSKALSSIEYQRGQAQTRQYITADSKRMDIEPYYVNFDVIINNKKYKVMNALVLKNQPKRQIIIGTPELTRHDFVLHEKSGKITVGTNWQTTIAQRYSVNQVRAPVNRIKPKIAMISAENVEHQKPVEYNENDHKIETDTHATIGDTCYMGRAAQDWSNEQIYDPSQLCLGCPKCTTTENKILDDHYEHITDSKHALRIMCEKIRNKAHNTFTHEQVTITEIGQKVYPWATKRIREINEKYKCNFAESIGDMGAEFTADCEIKGQFSKRLVGQQPFVGKTKAAIKKQLINLLANDVIGMADDDGVTPMYFINLMPRVKKDDNGVEYCPMVALVEHQI